MKAEEIFNIKSEEDFNHRCIETFLFQYENILIYKEFVNLINKKPSEIQHFTQIPFLPISFFKSHKVFNENLKYTGYFQSSGTTQSQHSKHFFHHLDFYKKSIIKNFEEQVGEPSSKIILGLLPNYLENPHSSLIYMVNYLMQQTDNEWNGYYLNEHSELENLLHNLRNESREIVLFGVSFALLDFIENRTIENSNLRIVETGGMKGRKKEMTKDEVFEKLKLGFPNAIVGSEYGMTELFSQAYTFENQKYRTPSLMKILIRELEDPLTVKNQIGNGAINIIDLANHNSCSFIATDDLGKLNSDGTFEILGRMDHTDIRGCSLLIS